MTKQEHFEQCPCKTKGYNWMGKLVDGCTRYNDGNVVGEDKKEYTADKALNGEDTFEFSFAYNDTLKKDNVKDYSINVVR